jgi:glycerophosphoryl diester phosphodiesterase
MRATILAPVPTAAHPFLDWPGPIAFAHRGGASDAPENTLPAFQDALDLGYRYLETDVRCTADGVVVAFHDDNLMRTCNRPGKISELPWSEVRTAMVDGKAPIPSLEELLGALPGARVNIDCKANDTVDALVAAIKRTDALDRVCLASFSDRRLKRLRAALPDACTALGPQPLALLRYGLLRHSPAQAAQVPVKEGPLTVTNARLVERAHRLGVQVHVWTIDDPAEMNRLLDLGVDGIMTDKPAVLKQVLTDRGEWHDG